MTGLQSEYYHWMVRLVNNDRPRRDERYYELYHYLNSVDFTYSLPMDGNRECDGINLRYRFGYEKGISAPIIASELDIRPCSVLEMMIALCMRCEEQIMTNPDIGNRLGEWFWNMVDSLGLMQMSDDRFDETYTKKTVNKFLQRRYRHDGGGGLFTIKYPPRDLRTVDIWYQMMWYLHDKIE